MGAPAASGATVRIATWNIHGGVGLDRRYRPQRIARVLAALDADVIALQEVELGKPDLVAALRDCGHGYCVEGPAMRRGSQVFGNMLLSRLPLHASRHIDLSRTGREPRAAIDAELRDPRLGPLRVLVTHLGLRGSEREAQSRRLLQALADEQRPLLLLGDFNEWRARPRRLHALQPRLQLAAAVATCPAALPLLALDRILASPQLQVDAVAAHRAGEARIASDHLPLVAQLRMRTLGA
ncbi:MAG TPA: endonuclease/exonuclease/phosphatase family protein [Rhodanobacteraceae bacterium]|nr:endonuclease/exonuclease/phosphatase family protein [Rhodanobacteraceae bacterium]